MSAIMDQQFDEIAALSFHRNNAIGGDANMEREEFRVTIFYITGQYGACLGHFSGHLPPNFPRRVAQNLPKR